MTTNEYKKLESLLRSKGTIAIAATLSNILYRDSEDSKFESMFRDAFREQAQAFAFWAHCLERITGLRSSEKLEIEQY